MLAATTVGAAALAAPAGAAVTIGSDLTATPHPSGSSCSNVTGAEYACTWFSTTIPDRVTAVPSDGVVTRWRIATGPGSAEQTVRLRVVRPGAPGHYTGAGTGDEEILPVTAGVATFPARLPVMAGDRVGLDQQQGKTGLFSASVAGAVNRVVNPVLADGSTSSSSAFQDNELLLNADVEPDADRDAFGDESQDQCLNSPGPQDGCPVAGPQPTPTPTPTPAPTPPPTEGVALVPGTCVHPVDGTDGPDDLIGSAFADVMQGLDGDDEVRGEGGDDCLFGDVSRPLSASPAPASRPDGEDELFGADGSDLLQGGNQGDSLSGGKRSDRLYGETGSDRLAGNARGDGLFGGRGADRLLGGRGGDRLRGGAGDDVLRGGPGSNRYAAGPGDDRVVADNGVKDEIDCGAGKSDRARIDRGMDSAVGCETVSRMP